MIESFDNIKIRIKKCKERWCEKNSIYCGLWRMKFNWRQLNKIEKCDNFILGINLNLKFNSITNY